MGLGKGAGGFGALLIAGPTASGKSAAALELAERFGATIVNADSMQVYSDLSVLTARPSREEESRAPHRLFGEIDGAINFSVGSWTRRVKPLIEAARAEARPLIVVGGTGLYFRALTEGLSAIPATPEALRERVRAAAEGVAAADLHADLARRDPLTAARLRPSDRQRVLRALEVFEATGKPLASFQGAREAAALGASERAGLFLAPERAALFERIDRRFEAMVGDGALEEVEALARRGLDPALPAMRAHGVPHLIAFLQGRLSREEAIARSQRDTRHYAKRQFTWARHQLPGFRWIASTEAVAAGQEAFAFRARRP
jgi:tRNA dimethylallyltransferase